MKQEEKYIATLKRREAHRDWYLLNKDPIYNIRLMWRAQGFRHLVHLLPGESILELGSGSGHFTKALYLVSKGRNPITACRFTDNDNHLKEEEREQIEYIHATTITGTLAGRQFKYVIVRDLLDREDGEFILDKAYEFLEDGGQVVFIESNPWNIFFAIKNLFRRTFGLPCTQKLVNRTELYKLFSEVGFIRVSALYTDFVYAPLTPGMIWLFRNFSLILENMPLVQTMAGNILVYAQKPPVGLPRPAVSLCRHETLRNAISVVVPCHNEEMNIIPLVEGLKNHYDEYLHQIVLVDDCSVDGTRPVIERLVEEDPRITPVFRKHPNGVGRALRDGFNAATGTYVLSMDCDFQHLLPELEDMLDVAAEGEKIVFGSRFSRSSLLIGYPFGKIIANRAFHLLVNLIFRRSCRDVSNNLKLVRTDILRKLTLKENGFAVNAELGLQLVVCGSSFTEVPISWINRSFDMGESSFNILLSGGGYARVLGRLALRTLFGTRSLET